jgi:hypothetical protein
MNLRKPGDEGNHAVAAVTEQRYTAVLLFNSASIKQARQGCFSAHQVRAQLRAVLKYHHSKIF